MLLTAAIPNWSTGIEEIMAVSSGTNFSEKKCEVCSIWAGLYSSETMQGVHCILYNALNYFIMLNTLL